MTAVFIVCAATGGTVLIVQFLLALVGLGGEALDIDVDADVGHDMGGDFHGDAGDAVDAHHGTTWLFGVLSFRTVVAALAFFGLGGLAAQSTGAAAPTTLLVAAAAGAAAMVAVYWMMRGLHELRAEGTVRLHRAVDRHGTVYLRVPGDNAGTGKIQLNLQNRTVECLAVTSGPELSTGTKVVVLRLVNPTTVEVRRDE